jgi:hypothetical protein
MDETAWERHVADSYRRQAEKASETIKHTPARSLPEQMAHTRMKESDDGR